MFKRAFAGTGIAIIAITCSTVTIDARVTRIEIEKVTAVDAGPGAIPYERPDGARGSVARRACPSRSLRCSPMATKEAFGNVAPASRNALRAYIGEGPALSAEQRRAVRALLRLAD